MRQAFDTVYDKAVEHDQTLRIGAYVLAIKKVADALRMRGIYAYFAIGLQFMTDPG